MFQYSSLVCVLFRSVVAASHTSVDRAAISSVSLENGITNLGIFALVKYQCEGIISVSHLKHTALSDPGNLFAPVHREAMWEWQKCRLDHSRPRPR